MSHNYLKSSFASRNWSCANCIKPACCRIRLYITYKKEEVGKKGLLYLYLCSASYYCNSYLAKNTKYMIFNHTWQVTSKINLDPLHFNLCTWMYWICCPDSVSYTNVCEHNTAHEYLLKAKSTNSKFKFSCSNNDLSDIMLTCLKFFLELFANIKANGYLWSSPRFSKHKK